MYVCTRVKDREKGGRVGERGRGLCQLSQTNADTQQSRTTRAVVANFAPSPAAGKLNILLFLFFGYLRVEIVGGLLSSATVHLITPG